MRLGTLLVLAGLGGAVACGGDVSGGPDPAAGGDELPGDSDGDPSGDPNPADLDTTTTGLTRAASTSCQLGSAPPVTMNPSGIGSQSVFPSASSTGLSGLVPVPNEPQRLALVELQGRVIVIDTQSGNTNVALDIQSLVEFPGGSGESGLHSIAFHPDFAANGYVFAIYSIEGTNDSRLVRFTRRSGVTALELDPATSLEILFIDRPATNHNGGQIAFGPDGFLYVSMGDSGGGGDPSNVAQNTSSLLGKVLRLDVDNPQGTEEYGIPVDNPFAGSSTARREIWAYGLRNPWRFSFDAVSGELWLADVGQGAREEIDVITRGGNYGWDILEGFSCHDETNGSCDDPQYIAPVYDYANDATTCAVTGGFVYRGTALPELYGWYVFSDYCGGAVVARNPGSGAIIDLFSAGFGVTSFGQDAAGELYALKSDGEILKLVRTGTAPNTDFPLTLSATGCYSDVADQVAAAGLVPYDLVVPFWSDRADKRRWLSLPGTSTVTYAAEGAWSFPVGTIFMKEFTLGGRLLETRFMLQRTAGVWEGYTYKWNAEGTEAHLLDDAVTESYQLGSESVAHYYPTRAECLRCHNSAAGFALGLQTRQLNREQDYGAGMENQIRALALAGFVTGVTASQVSSLPRLTDPTDTAASLNDRARAYLHSNCTSCHRPSGERPSPNFLVTTPLADSGICGVVQPGNAGGSLLFQRASVRGGNQMPPIATIIVDQDGADLLEAWIDDMTTCP